MKRVLALCTLALTCSCLPLAAQSRKTVPTPDSRRLIGSWRLTDINSPTPDGKPQPPKPIGLFIYTADGHEAVQLMYPKSAQSLNNEFVHDGYEGRGKIIMK